MRTLTGSFLLLYKKSYNFNNEKSSKMNLDVSISDLQISVFQEDPWHVALLFSFSLHMQDKAGLASWNKTESIKSLIKIEEFEDPLYLLNTNAKVTNKK